MFNNQQAHVKSTQDSNSCTGTLLLQHFPNPFLKSPAPAVADSARAESHPALEHLGRCFDCISFVRSRVTARFVDVPDT